MASGFGTKTSSNYFTSGNGRGYLRAYLKQTVDANARTVKIELWSCLCYYRNSGGNWNPGTSNLFYNHTTGNYVKATVDGETNTEGPQLGLKGNNKTLNVGSYYDEYNSGAVKPYNVAHTYKSKTYNYDASGAAITKSWSASIKYGSTTMNLSGSVTTDSISSAYTPPSGVDAVVVYPYDTGAEINVTAESAGNPSDLARFYIGGAILNQSTYGDDYRYAIANGSLDDTVVVNNTTPGTPGFKIIGNTEYYYGVWATNTAADASDVIGTFVTLPAYITSVDVLSNAGGKIRVALNHDQEGSADTIEEEYRIGSGAWNTLPSSGIIPIPTPTATVSFRRSNSYGITPVETITVNRKHIIYGPVNGQSKKIKKLYGSVNGQSKRIRKLYVSVNGRAKLVHLDES